MNTKLLLLGASLLLCGATNEPPKMTDAEIQDALREPIPRLGSPDRYEVLSRRYDALVAQGEKEREIQAPNKLQKDRTNEPPHYRLEFPGGHWRYEFLQIDELGTNYLYLIQPHWQLETNWVDADEWDFFNYFFNERMVKFPGCDPDYRAALDTWGQQWIRQRERGTVSSNLLAVIEWKGQRFTNTLETNVVTHLTRKYTTKEVRVYE